MPSVMSQAIELKNDDADFTIFMSDDSLTIAHDSVEIKFEKRANIGALLEALVEDLTKIKNAHAVMVGKKDTLLIPNKATKKKSSLCGVPEQKALDVANLVSATDPVITCEAFAEKYNGQFGANIAPVTASVYLNGLVRAGRAVRLGAGKFKLK